MVFKHLFCQRVTYNTFFISVVPVTFEQWKTKSLDDLEPFCIPFQPEKSTAYEKGSQEYKFSRIASPPSL